MHPDRLSSDRVVKKIADQGVPRDNKAETVRGVATASDDTFLYVWNETP